MILRNDFSQRPRIEIGPDDRLNGTVIDTVASASNGDVTWPSFLAFEAFWRPTPVF